MTDLPLLPKLGAVHEERALHLAPLDVRDLGEGAREREDRLPVKRPRGRRRRRRHLRERRHSAELLQVGSTDPTTSRLKRPGVLKQGRRFYRVSIQL